MAKTLDKTKKYGQIFGIHEYGAVFEQGGACFGADGREVGPGITLEITDPVRPGAAGPAPTAPVGAPKSDDELRAELGPLHPAKIAKLLTDAQLPIAGGPGSKSINIETLIAANSAG